MTWFLNNALPNADAPAVEGQIPGWGQQFTGSGRDLWWRRDSWDAARSYAGDLEEEMVRALGGHQLVYPRDAEGIREFLNPRTRGRYLAGRIARARAEDQTGALGTLPATAEEFDAEVLRRRKTDFDENRAMLDRGDSASARVLGEMAASVLEPESLATMPLGGSIRNVGRFILSEAALGVASDVPGVIREQGVADDLGFQPSNPVVELGMSAAASAGFAGVLAGGARALDLMRARRAAESETRPPGYDGMDWENDVNAAERALREGREPPAPQGAGIDEGYFAAIRSAESGGDDAARNPLSSATGRYQFTAGTWGDMIRRHPDLGLTPDGRLDPVQQERAIRAFTADNARILRGAEIPIDRGNLYAAHFLGAGDAARVLRADPGARLTDLLSAQVINANPFLRSMSVEDFRGWTRRKTGGSGDASAGDVDPPPSGPTGIDWPRQHRRASDYDEVTTPGGMSVRVRYRVADAGELRAAGGDLQPRDRSRSASDEQIAQIARELDPRRLMPSVETTHGAPVISPDGIVESGNGRVAALNRAAEEHPDNFAAYVRAIEDAGYEIPEGVSRPVLVAERVSDLDPDSRRRFVRESNTSNIGRMSATEQAGVDADYLSQHAFDGYRPGRALNSTENADFVRRVFASMPQAERAALMTADGRLNIDGLRRLRQALFARAFGADDLLRMLAETEHPAVENMLRMLEDLAPDWAAFRAAVDAGYVRPEFDITDQLMDAVRAIARARIDNREGQSVIAALRDRLAQGDMFDARDPDMADAMIGVFYRGDRARTAEASSSILQRYIADAEMSGRADMDDLLGSDAAITPVATLRRAVEAQDARAPLPERMAAEPLAEGPETQVSIRALDGVDMKDGAQSPALLRSTDAALRDLAETPETGAFGPVYRDIENDPEAAIAHLMSEQAGEVPVAYRHPDARLGDIALVYGTEKFGLRHIELKHPEMIADIPRLLREGRIVEDANGLPRIYLTDEGNPPAAMVVRLDWDNAEKHWVVTSFRDDQGQVARHLRTSNEPDASVSSRIPDTTGPKENSISAPEIPEDEIQTAVTEARRALEAEPDLTIRLGEGDDAQSYALADLLDDLDQDQNLITRMTSCSLKGAPK